MTARKNSLGAEMRVDRPAGIPGCFRDVFQRRAAEPALGKHLPAASNNTPRVCSRRLCRVHRSATVVIFAVFAQGNYGMITVRLTGSAAACRLQKAALQGSQQRVARLAGIDEFVESHVLG